jgi:hypothetical protein
MSKQNKNLKEETNKANAEAKTQSIAALKAQLSEQLVGHRFGPPESPDEYEKPTNIVTAGNGVFRVIKTPIAIFKTQLAETTNVGKSKTERHTIPGIPSMEEGVERLVPKIPFKYWLQAFNFYKDVDTKDKTEASILFFWNTNDVELPTEYEDNTSVKGLTQDGKLIIYCPRQKNSGGLSEFGQDGMVEHLRKHTTPLLETHSHHTMNAYFSGTDDANENMNQFYAVFGKIQSKETAFAFRFCSGQHKIECDPSELFDFPKIKKTTVTTEEFVGVDGVEPQVQEHVVESNFKGPWPVVEYPKDWLEQHTITKRTVNNYGYDYGPYAPNSGSKNANNPHWRDAQHYLNGEDYSDQFGYGANYTQGASAGGAKKTTYTPGKQEDRDLKKNANASGVVETNDTKVELFAMNIANTFNEEEVKDLVTELCDFGYDHLLLDVIKDNSSYDHSLLNFDY